MLNKKKADMNMVIQPVSVLIFVGITVALVFFVLTSMVKYSADLTTTDKQVLAVDAAHMVKSCFSGVSDSISESFLEKNTVTRNQMGNYGKKLCEIEECKICSLDVGARIDYLEGPKKGEFYDFGYNKDPNNVGMYVPPSYDHSIFVTINDGKNNYIGKLSVTVYDST